MGDYFRTTKTGGFAFLLIPATFRANATGRQRLHGQRQDLDDASRQFAVLAVKVGALAFFAARRKTKNVSRVNFASERE